MHVQTDGVKNNFTPPWEMNDYCCEFWKLFIYLLFASDVLVLHNVDPLVFQSVLWIRTGFNADPNPAFLSMRIQVPVGTVPCRSAEH